jgi:hypothetical protein
MLGGTTMAPNSPIIVVGMAKSGTGMLVKILEKLGVYMGKHNTENGESLFFKGVNRHILDSGFGCAWKTPDFMPTVQKIYEHYDWLANRVKVTMSKDLKNKFLGLTPRNVWGWKDPRNSLLLPIWHKVFPKATVIHIYRNTADVALSNMMHDWSRHGYDDRFFWDDNEKMDLYLRYIKLQGFFLGRIVASLEYIEKTYTVPYESIVSNPLAEIKMMVHYLDLPEDMVEDAASVVDPSKIRDYKEFDLSFISPSFERKTYMEN